MNGKVGVETTAGRRVPFRVLREDWNRYTILDGAVEVVFRTILMRLIELDPKNASPGVQFSMKGQFLVAAFGSSGRTGKPDPTPAGPEVISQMQVVPFKVIDEPVNEYLLEGERVVSVRTVATAISILPGRFDADGEPMISVVTTNAISPPRPARVDELRG